jgi:hypothetical protein
VRAFHMDHKAVVHLDYQRGYLDVSRYAGA